MSEEPLFLTPLSRYPIVSCHFPINYDGVSQDPLLEVKEFTGFSVVRLKKRNGDFNQDTYAVINRLLMHFPDNATTVELHLAAAGLARMLGFPDWKNHIIKAEKSAGFKYLDKIEAIREYIKNSLHT